jgi:hypothetical protein
VQHVLEQVKVRRRHRVAKIAGHDRESLTQAERLSGSCRLGGDMWQVQHGAPQGGACTSEPLAPPTSTASETWRVSISRAASADTAPEIPARNWEKVSASAGPARRGGVEPLGARDGLGAAGPLAR